MSMEQNPIDNAFDSNKRCITTEQSINCNQTERQVRRNRASTRTEQSINLDETERQFAPKRRSDIMISNLRKNEVLFSVVLLLFALIYRKRKTA